MIDLDKLRERLNPLDLAINEFLTSEDESLYNANGQKQISQSLLDEVKLTNAWYAEQNYLPDAFEAVMFLDAFFRTFIDWANAIKEGDTSSQGHPAAPRAWNAWKHVKRQLEPKRYPLPQNIETMMAQNIPDDQIAEEYGWYENEVYDIERVAREKRNPGSELKLENWESPHKKAAIERAKKAWPDRKPAVFHQAEFEKTDEDDGKSYMEKHKANWKEPVARESIEQLIQQGLSAEQIHRIKPEATREDIMQAGKAMGKIMDVSQIPQSIANDPAVAIGDMDRAEELVDQQFRQRTQHINNQPTKTVTQHVMQIVGTDPNLPIEDVYRLVTVHHPHATYKAVEVVHESVVGMLSEADEIEELYNQGEDMEHVETTLVEKPDVHMQELPDSVLQAGIEAGEVPKPSETEVFIASLDRKELMAEAKRLGHKKANTTKSDELRDFLRENSTATS